MTKAMAANVGPGNIGTDLLAKLQRSEHVRWRTWSGWTRPPKAWTGRGGRGSRRPGGGVDWLLDRPERPDLVFEATSARAHLANAPRYAEAGIQVVDLTPAAVGPMVCPPVNLSEHLAAPNVNMITCGGQATIPRRPRGVGGDAGAVCGDRGLNRVALRRAGNPGQHRRVRRIRCPA